MEVHDQDDIPAHLKPPSTSPDTPPVSPFSKFDMLQNLTSIKEQFQLNFHQFFPLLPTEEEFPIPYKPAKEDLTYPSKIHFKTKKRIKNAGKLYEENHLTDIFSNFPDYIMIIIQVLLELME